MSRESKFRGISMVTGKWVYGNLLQSNPYSDGRIDCWIQPKSIVCLGIESTPTSAFNEVHPKTVGQFTGLHDAIKWEDRPEKYGVEIFEGDIVRVFMGHTLSNYEESKPVYINKVVVWNNYHCRFEWGDGRGSPFGNKNAKFKYEVIGNIHHNPELIEGGVA